MLNPLDLIPDTPSDDALWLRQSTVNSWELCPARVGQADHAGFRGLPSEAMSWGSLEHALIETDLVGGGRLYTAEEVADFWRHIVREEYGVELDELASETVIRDGAVEALGAYQLWVDRVKPFLLGTHLDWEIEERNEAFLGYLPSHSDRVADSPSVLHGREAWLHGTGDLIAPELEVGYDWKTAGRGWKDTKVHFLGQPNAYAYLALVNYGEWIDDWHYWVYDRQKVRWQLHRTTRTQAQVTAWLRHAFNIATAIDAGAYPYTPTQDTFGNVKRGWWCSPKYCGAWDICKGKYLNDDVDESTEGTITWV